MRNLVFLFSLSVAFFALGACQQSASSLVAVSSNLDTYSHSKLHWGDVVDIKMETTSHDSIQLQLNGKNVDGNSFTLSAENSVLGKNGLKLTVFTGSESSTREVSIMVLAKRGPGQAAFSVINIYPHNPEYFTEGFYHENGIIYEGTGLNGKSKLVKYHLATAKVEKEVDLEQHFFGEGIAVVGDSIFQLTYKAQKAFIYNRSTLQKVGEFDVPFSAEGWGLCYDGESLIMSNGSHYLYFMDPKDFTLQRSLQVVHHKGVCNKLNELEFYGGKIYANVWYEKEIVVINPATGAVEQVISLADIPAKNYRQGVANGIAIKDGNLLVTGKNWTEMYELQILGRGVE